MVGYTNNDTIDTYKLDNPETKRVIITRDVKWEEWEMTDPAENLKMFRDTHKKYLVPGKYENKITTSKTEDKLHVHLIPDEGESVRLKNNQIRQSSLTTRKTLILSHQHMIRY